MRLLIIAFLTLVSITYECSIPPPKDCPSPTTRRLSLPVLPKLNLYFQEQHPPTDTIRGVPLLTFPSTFSVGIIFLNSTDLNRNQLGYFTLPPKASLPESPSGLNVSLIFSDTKYPCTQSGDPLNIGPFPGGTQVGFYLVTDGWCGGISRQWSVPQYNEDKKPMTAVFFDPTTNTLVIGIEDNPSQQHMNYQDVVFQVETKPPLNLTWFEGSIAIACYTLCPDCNFTTGKCDYDNEIVYPPRVRNPSTYVRRSVLMGIMVCLGLLLVVAIAVIVYFVWQKVNFNRLMAGGWFPVMPASFVDEEEKSEEKDDLEERLKDDDL